MAAPTAAIKSRYPTVTMFAIPALETALLLEFELKSS